MNTPSTPSDCKYIARSLSWLQGQHQDAELLLEWITKGSNLNWSIHTGASQTGPDSLGWLMEDISALLRRADIQLKTPTYFFRETSFPQPTRPTLTSVTLYPHYTGTYGDKHYRIRVPAGTRVFFVSAVDLIPSEDAAPLPLEDTEQEFVLEPGVTRLEAEELIYYPQRFS
jgi:hypothetical protein